MKIPKKEKQNTNDHRHKTDSYYISKEWKRKKDYIWERDDSMCQICLDKGINHLLVRGTKDMNYQGTVDHTIPRNAGGSDEPSNLRLVGSRCHARKSNKDKKYYKVTS